MSVSEDEVAQLKALLNIKQLLKCDSINKRKKTEFILSRSVLSFCIKSSLKNTDISLDIQERPQLPPLVLQAQQNDIRFSISHSKNWLAIAITQGVEAVGFDLQVVKNYSDEQGFPGKDIERAQYFCNEPQLSELKLYKDDKRLFSRQYTKLWAMKEAYLKSLELGINHELLRKLEFTKASNQSGSLHSTTIENKPQDSFAVALYCQKSYTVTCHHLTLIKRKFHIEKFNSQLQWETFNVET
jgi:phosphopantetheinyl transferase